MSDCWEKLESFLQDLTRFLQVSYRILVSQVFLKITKVYKETFNLLIRSSKFPTRQLQKSCEYLPGSYKVLTCFLQESCKLERFL